MNAQIVPILKANKRQSWGAPCFFTILAFFARLSVVYDFHDCPHPSREHPYFHAGRMMLGTLVPFLLLIGCGLDRLLHRFRICVRYSALAVIVSAMLILEIATDWPVFSSPFNWFHLPWRFPCNRI